MSEIDDEQRYLLVDFYGLFCVGLESLIHRIPFSLLPLRWLLRISRPCQSRSLLHFDRFHNTAASRLVFLSPWVIGGHRVDRPPLLIAGAPPSEGPFERPPGCERAGGTRKSGRPRGQL